MVWGWGKTYLFDKRVFVTLSNNTSRKYFCDRGLNPRMARRNPGKLLSAVSHAQNSGVVHLRILQQRCAGKRCSSRRFCCTRYYSLKNILGK
ncbi:hypothetical protein CEXT_513721 [Caerostris extrusa]|uniref:Uncharacterized protein n=1 Tax=Caerostris extrusa TaxID=172846 RepID=A0AAV4XJ07_CAEEX|nr:hypothetical protein CEXT_513721 [Caerostris extrusa]